MAYRRRYGKRRYGRRYRKKGFKRSYRRFRKARKAYKKRKIARRLRSGGRYRILQETKDVGLVYRNAVTIATSGTGSFNWGPASTVLRLQSAYDPNYSITGTFNDYPGGHNLWKNFYASYCVLGVKLVTTMYQTSADGAAQYPIKWGVLVTDRGDDPVYYSGWEQISDVPWCKTRTLNTTADGSAKQTIVMNISPKKFWANNDIEDDDDCKANCDANPFKSCYAHVWYQVADKGIHALPYVTVEQKLFMYTRYYNPFDIMDLDNDYIPVQVDGGYEDAAKLEESVLTEEEKAAPVEEAGPVTA